jgi:CRP/FNR family transcriptional regulator
MLDDLDWQRCCERYPVFTSLAPEVVAEVRRAVRRAPVHDGDVLFMPGSACQGFPLVLDGQIRVSSASPAGRELVLYRVPAGESCVVTAMCLGAARNYNATGTVERDGDLLVVPKRVFDLLLATAPAFRQFVFGLFAMRMTELMQRIDEVAFQRLDQRVAAWLLRNHDAAREVHATHQQIADELGSVREQVTRAIRQLEAAGLLRTARQCITLVDLDGLARRVQAEEQDR